MLGCHIVWMVKRLIYTCIPPAPARARAFQKPQRPREPCWSRREQATPHLFPDQLLPALREPGGERAAALYFSEIVCADGAFAKGSCQYIGRRNGVLDGQV